MGITFEEWTNDEREQEVFPLLSPSLLSCVESQKVCAGFFETCGDEPEPGDELCRPCRRAEDRFYLKRQQDQQLAEDRYRYDQTDRGMVG